MELEPPVNLEPTVTQEPRAGPALLERQVLQVDLEPRAHQGHQVCRAGQAPQVAPVTMAHLVKLGYLVEPAPPVRQDVPARQAPLAQQVL